PPATTVSLHDALPIYPGSKEPRYEVIAARAGGGHDHAEEGRVAACRSQARGRQPHGANISWSTKSACRSVCGPSLPSRLTRRSWSTVRIWSRTTCPTRPANLQGIRNGYGCPPVVRGATMNVRR